jgi:hypothetical protein
VRVFRARLPGTKQQLEFYRTFDNNNKAALDKSAGRELMMDDVNGSKWNFRGCAIDGAAAGMCLEHLDAIKDYWFDWCQYNPETTVYRR